MTSILHKIFFLIPFFKKSFVIPSKTDIIKKIKNILIHKPQFVIYTL